ncbi:MAG: aminoacetone oxidase family FAD-binding enzyme [Lachnospiraceae bacterium]|nr:aminoacetone oxidase family FAD-binding enzyme [Lachnospiraceae bacterium]
MNIAVIGGGASGMIAAVISKRSGNDVTVFEHMPRVGKKLLLTGNGKCNISNTDMDPGHFHSGDLERVKNVLEKYPPARTLAFFEELGLRIRDRGGYLYPYSENASAVVDALRFSIRDLGIDVMTGADVLSVSKVMNGNDRSAEGRFVISSNDRHYHFDCVIICTGSCAQRNTGSDGSGYNLAKRFGHTIIKPLPALTYLTCEEDFFPSIAGIRTRAAISMFMGSSVNSCTDLCGVEVGELQLTKTGISGIPVFNLSHIAIKALDEGRFVRAVIDLVPDIPSEDIRSYMKDRLAKIGTRTVEEMLIGVLAKTLGICVCKRCGLDLRRSCSSLSENDIAKVCRMLKQFEVTVKGHGSFENAQVSQGGVSLEEVDDNLESRLVSGLYFAGEILDVFGDCGGYNLQWAASSAMAAAYAAALASQIG